MPRSSPKVVSSPPSSRFHPELTSFLNGVKLPGAILDAHGRVVFANKHLLEMTRHEHSRVEGRDYFAVFVPGDIRRKLRTAYRRSMAAGFVQQETENDIVTRDGRRITISWHNVLHRDTRGRIIGFTCIGRATHGWVSLDHAQEVERRKLARALHDGVGQSLAVLGISLRLAKTAVESGDRAGAVKGLDESLDLAEGVAARIRDVMEELRPRVLDDYGLIPALRWYAKSFSRRTGVMVSFAGGEPRRRLSPDVETVLFRIALEALTNVAKHAHARNVEIAMSVGGGVSKLTVTDDGVGLKHGDAWRSGRGLEIMRERTASIGGMLEITSGPRGGTTLSVLIRR